MPSLSSSDNSVNIKVQSEADTSGIKETESSVSDLASTGRDTQSKLSTFTDSFQDGMKKVSVATGIVGAGLSVYAKSSVNYLQDLVKSSKTLGVQTGMTAEDSSKLIAAMGRLGVNSDSATSSFRIFAKVITNARDTAASTALTQQALTDKIDGTKIKITQLNDQIKLHGDASGAMQNQVQSLTTQLAQYQQQLGANKNALNDLGISTQDAQGKNKGFNDILMEVADKFKSMPDGAEKTAEAMKLFGRSGADMIKVLNQGADGLQNLENQADKLGLTLTAQNIGTISQYVTSQKNLADSTNSVKIAVGQLTAPILTNFNIKMNDMLTALIGVDSPLRGVTTAFLAFGGPVMSGISAISGFAGNVGSAIPLISDLSKAVGGFGAAFGWLTVISLAIAAIIAIEQNTHFFSETWKKLQPVLKVIGDLIGTYIVPVLRTMWEVMKVLVQEGLEQLRQAFEKIKPWLIEHKQLLESIAVVIGVAMLLPLATFVAAVVGVGLVIAATIYAIGAVINWLVDAFRWGWGVIKGIWDWLYNATYGTMVGIINTIYWLNNTFWSVVYAAQNMANNLMNTIRGIPGWIMNAIGNLGGLLYNVGRDIISGLINGVGSMWGNAVNYVKNLGGDIAKALKDKLGIHSPSLVFQEIGKFTGQGLIDGLASMNDSVQKAATDLINPVNALNPNISLSGSGGGNSSTVGGSPRSMTDGSGGGSVHIYGDINLGDQGAVETFFKQIDRNNELAQKGLTTVKAAL